MGYISEIIAMKRRYERNRPYWQLHLEHTRRFILSAAEKCERRRRTVILGAGLLLDVPLDELSRMFREVVLLDIVFLPEVRSQVKRYANIKLVQHDVTNMAGKLHENIQHGRPELPESAPSAPEIDEDTGLVVSLNMLSQLWVVPRAYVLRKLPCLDADQIDDWCSQIVESHYAFLQSMSCPVCFVADHEVIKRDREERIVSRGSTITGLVLPEPDASWTWDIVPINEDRQYVSKQLIVGAWHLRSTSDRG